MRVVVLVRRPADASLVAAVKGIGEVAALCVGPEAEARPALAAARAAGAKRLVRVWEPALETTDYLGIAYALAAAVRAIGDPAAAPMLIVAGDRGRGVVGPAVAERLGVPLIGQVLGVEVRDGKIVAKRRGRDVVRSYGAAPPALVSMIVDAAAAYAVGDAGEPRERSEPIEMESWALTKVGLSGAELSYRKHFRPQPVKGPVPSPRRFADAAALAARLRADGLVRGGR